MLQALCGILNARLVFAASSGPPNGVVGGLRVSATRHGVTGMNCNAIGGGGAASCVTVKFWPAMTIVPTRAEDPELPSTERVTSPLSELIVPPVT